VIPQANGAPEIKVRVLKLHYDESRSLLLSANVTHSIHLQSRMNSKEDSPQCYS